MTMQRKHFGKCFLNLTFVANISKFRVLNFMYKYYIYVKRILDIRLLRNQYPKSDWSSSKCSLINVINNFFCEELWKFPFLAPFVTLEYFQGLTHQWSNIAIFYLHLGLRSATMTEKCCKSLNFLTSSFIASKTIVSLSLQFDQPQFYPQEISLNNLFQLESSVTDSSNFLSLFVIVYSLLLRTHFQRWVFAQFECLYLLELV